MKESMATMSTMSKGGGTKKKGILTNSKTENALNTDLSDRISTKKQISFDYRSKGSNSKTSK